MTVQAEDFGSMSTLEKVEVLKSRLSDRATGGDFTGGDKAYRDLRSSLRLNARIFALLPDFVRQCSTTNEYWNFIKLRFERYQERNEFLREAFAPVLDHLESDNRGVAASAIDATLSTFNADAVRDVWEKALSRRSGDPDGAITAARALLESVCKHILDDSPMIYKDDEDLPKLWHLASTTLRLAPNQQQDDAFRAILGNCQAVVQGVAQIRNKAGDAHGFGRSPDRPTVRHAELVVNLAGAMAAFLVDTWEEEQAKTTEVPF